MIRDDNMVNSEKFIISPDHIKKMANYDGLNNDDFQVPSNVILTFNKGVVDELKKICNLEEWEWKAAKYNQYYRSPKKSWRGKVGSKEIFVVVPPMGASPIAAFSEDLIYFGAERIFLLCASWSLGSNYLDKGQIHLPSFAMGVDGTSIHYMNENGHVKAQRTTLNEFRKVLNMQGADWKMGGVGSCEAFYRICEKMLGYYRKKGCLSVENGEVAALYSIAREYDFPIGVLLQPYIDLEKGIDKSYMGEEYNNTCKMQARVAVEVIR